MTKCAMCLTAAALFSGGAAAAQPVVRERSLGPIVAASPVSFRSVTSIRALSDGRVLVNDASGRQIVMLDSRLGSPRVLLDSISGKDNSYGSAAGALVPYPGDSTLFVDRTARSFLLMDPAGRVVRVIALPGPGAETSLATSSTFGSPAVLPALGLVYALSIPAPRRPNPDLGDQILADSLMLMSLDLGARRGEPLLSLETGRGTALRRLADGSFEVDGVATDLLSIFRVFDDWAVLKDGSVAVLRGREYRIEWIDAAGKRSTSPRIPHEWVRNSEQDKAQLADSLNVERQRADSLDVVRWRADSVAIAGGRRIPFQAIAANNPALRAQLLAGLLTDADIERIEAKPPPPTPRPRVEPRHIPDYLPAFSGGMHMRADAEGNLWIRTRQPGAPVDGIVYDIVNRVGELIGRVRIPGGKTLAGFGPSGVVYIVSRDAGMARLEAFAIR